MISKSELDSELDENATIWRYMRFEQLYEIVKLRKLSCTLLKDYHHADGYEGGPTGYRQLLPHPNMFAEEEQRKKAIESDDVFEKICSSVAVSCWRIDDDESYVMWKLYANDPSCVAIKSSIGRLRNAVRDESFEIDRVTYSNFSANESDCATFEEVIFHKEDWFAFEKELRGRILVDPINTKRCDICVEIDPNILIDQIVLHYSASELITDCIREFTPNFTIAPSRISISRPKFLSPLEVIRLQGQMDQQSVGRNSKRS